MGTKTFNNYESLLTFTRASKGHALRPVSYGSELVTNGTFDTDSDWTKSSGATISGGKLNISVTASGYEYAYQLEEFKVGAIYVLTATVNGTSGFNMRFRAGGDDSGLGANDGRVAMTGSDQQVQKIFQATGTADRINIERDSGGDYSFTVDNVSLKEVTFDESDGTLTLFEHPNNIPRVEWDADRNRLGLLVEQSRTNLFSDSDAKDWTVTGSGTSTINTEFTLGAFTGVIKASGGADWHRVRTTYISVTSGTTYYLTVFYKYGTSNNVLLNFRNADGATESRVVGAWGSLTNSLSGAGTLTVLEETSLPNDVKKVVVKYVPNFSGNFEFGVGPNSTTSGETVIPLAAQVEQASFGTSYIKTTGATATRSADVASIPVADFGYNHKEITVMAEFIAPNWASSSTYHRVLSFDGKWGVFNDGSTASGTVRYRFDNDSNVAQFGAGNLDAATYGTSETMSKVAFALKNNDAAITKDGNAVGTDTSGDYDIELRTTLTIGAESGSTNYLSGHLKTLKVYPRRLTNAQLQDITS